MQNAETRASDNLIIFPNYNYEYDELNETKKN